MKISLIWKINPDSKNDQRAVTLAGLISQEAKVALFSGHALHRMEEWEGLTLEVSGLTQELPEEGSGQFKFVPHVGAKLHTIKQALQKYGVDAEIMLDGWSLLQYATQQEWRVLRREKAMEEAIAMLKKTRKIFGKKIFEDVRHRLEAGLNDSTN